MSVTVITSAHSCGTTVSSLALTLSAPNVSLLVEADCSQGSIRHGFQQGRWGPEIGLWHLAEAQLQDQLAEAFETHLRAMDSEGNRWILPGLTDPLQAATLAGTWEPLAGLLQVMDQGAGYDVFVDAGRLVAEPGRVHPTLYPAALLHRADMVLLVVRNTLTSVAQTVPVAAALREELDRSGTGADALRIVMIAEESRSHGMRSDAIARRLQAPVVAMLPWDPATAQLFTHGSERPVKLAKAPLAKQARTACEQLAVDVRTRRLRLQMPPAAVSSPVVAGVLQRLAASRQQVPQLGQEVPRG
ncbi:MinD/ParA family ATP-binding protein [Streptomyces cavernicola]|uniref:Cellulose biosynthesis protein BcsQ n=1 Tax=Streptomyces cavernicola TaxID=3043613 RepID=A0ABT6SKB5_9ACTN|nr:hypothetical protein [Streptomyces sp. B-S-A6]MDI3408349.1 hypothetical protein [Streptomyces sp. B-S-A6]